MLPSRPPALPLISIGKLGAVFLLIFACKLCLMRACSSPLPFFDQWEAEGEKLLKPWLEGHLHWADLLAPHAQHRILWTRLLVLGLFQLNGQWDAQVEMIAAALLHAGCAAALGAILIRRVGRGWENAILLALAPLFCLPFDWEDTLSGGIQSTYYFLILFSTLTIWGLGSHRAGSGRWWLGLASAPCAWFTVASGPLATAAVAAWMVVRRRRPEDRTRGDRITLAVSVALTAAGLSLSLGVSQVGDLKPTSGLAFFTVFAGFLSWPTQTPVCALLTFLPLALLLWRQVRARRDPAEGRTAESFLLPMGFWVIFQAAVLAFARNRYFDDPLTVSRYMVVFSPGVLVNFSCLLVLFRDGAPGQVAGTRRPVRAKALGAAWGAFVLLQLGSLTKQNLDVHLPFVKGNNARQREVLAAWVATGNPLIFKGKSSLDIQSDQPVLVARLLRLPIIKNVLPACVRPPLALEPAADTRGFATEPKPPTVDGGAAEPAWVGQAAGDGQTAFFRSQEITRGAPYLEFTILGRVGTPQACIGLIGGDPRRNVWLLPGAGSVGPDGWRRVLVATPPPPFHVEAISREGAESPVIFLNPREVGPLSAWAAGLLNGGVPLVFAGLAGLAALGSWQRFTGIEVALEPAERPSVELPRAGSAPDAPAPAPGRETRRTAGVVPG